MSKPPHKSGGSKSGGFKSGGSGRGRPPGGPSRSGPSSSSGGERGPERGRGAGERSFGDRNRARSAADRDRNQRASSERPAERGTERSRNERDLGDRSRIERNPARLERGERASGERSFGERSPVKRGPGERSTSERGTGKRRYGERSTNERDTGEPRFGGRGTSERSYGKGGQDHRPRLDRDNRPGRAVTRKATHAAPHAAAPTPKDPSLPEREGERIAKLLARAGVASRREAERLIEAGRVKLGEEVIDTPSTVLPNLRGVTVDGNPIAEPEGTRLFLFHKPSGLLTAERDPAGRPTIYTALGNSLPEGAGRVMPVGRLDLNTEGLLLLTNDGEFKRQLELPATGVPRTYRARTFGDITQAQLEELMEGIEVDGVIYGQIDANMERRTGRNQWIEMTLTEGKNREVRRVLEALGLQVSRLIRVAYGPFRLGDLPKGAAGEISQKDLEDFRKTLPSIRPKAGLKNNKPKDEA